MQTNTIVIKNPGSGVVLGEIELTNLESLPQVFADAKGAQKYWGSLPLSTRAKKLLDLRETLITQIDQISKLISDENGKPQFEAMTNEILAVIELITFFSKNGKGFLKNEKIPMGLMKHRKSYLQNWPLGVVAVISPWNYPFLLPMGEIVMAVLAGNAVVFKPSEITPLIGLKIQGLFDDAGFPKGLVQTVVGDGKVGAAIIDQKPGKIFFTGSVATGKRIMAQAAQYLTPVNLELGGKDPMIVMADADLDFATSAALWGAFSNSGQICASVERIIVHESIAERFNSLLKEKVLTLRQGPSGPTRETDLGAITFEKQKAIYDRQIEQAKDQGAIFLTGGEWNQDRRFLSPALVTGKNIESLDIYKEETFGPVVAITTYKTTEEAIEKANDSPYGLLASVIGKDLKAAEKIALQLEAGTITINEVVYTAGLPETPWGGLKDTGFGKKHSARGLLEFVHTRHIHMPRSSLFVFKSLWWFPYTPFQYAAFRQFAELYRNSWVTRIRALPSLLWNFLHFLKDERRL